MPNPALHRTQPAVIVYHQWTARSRSMNHERSMMFHEVILPYVFGAYLVVSVLGSVPIIVWGRVSKRVHWRPLNGLAVVLPLLTWLALMYSGLAADRKSWTNIAEPIHFSFAVPVAVLVRLIVGTGIRESVCSASLIALLCFVASVVFFLTPPLPE
jgi:MFS family permease